MNRIKAIALSVIVAVIILFLLYRSFMPASSSGYVDQHLPGKSNFYSDVHP